MKISKILNIIIGALLVISIGINIFLAVNQSNYDAMVQYLQEPYQMSVVYSGILKNHEYFRTGENLSIIYDFESEDYPVLLEEYNLAEIAGNGSEYERAVRLMKEYAPRLNHCSNFDNSVELKALSLLEFSLDEPENGINCRCKAQVLNEMLLALNIYSRKMWIKPDSIYDEECHVVNEVWDSKLNKWILVDISNNIYWVNKEGTPLSVLEVRQLLANREFCTPVYPGDDCSDLEKSRNNNYGLYLYYMKNLVYTIYCDTMTTGESEGLFYLIPENTAVEDNMKLISESAITDAPK